MKTIYNLIVIALLTMLMANNAFAQEWTKEQLEVWKVVQDTWKNWQTKNVDGIAATLHEKYQGWDAESPLPIGKKELIDWFSSMKDAMNFHYFFVQPARITVLKNAAVVDYYFEYAGEFTMNGKTVSKESKGKTVEFYSKEDGKWLLLGDFMTENGDDNEEDDD